MVARVVWIAIGVLGGALLAQGPSIRGAATDWPRRVRESDPTFQVELERISEGERTASWRFWRALAALSVGDRETAERCALEAAAEGVPRAWVLASVLDQFRDEPGREVPWQERWSRNTSLREQRSILEFARSLRARVVPEPTGILSVRSFGPWPSWLPEPRSSRAEALQGWRGYLLPHLARDRNGDGRGQVVVRYVSVHEDLAALVSRFERLWQELARPPWALVWVLPPGHVDAQRLAQVFEGTVLPHFVAPGASDSTFAARGFRYGGVTLWLDGDAKLRYLLPPGLPLLPFRSELERVLR